MCVMFWRNPSLKVKWHYLSFPTNLSSYYLLLPHTVSSALCSLHISKQWIYVQLCLSLSFNDIQAPKLNHRLVITMLIPWTIVHRDSQQLWSNIQMAFKNIHSQPHLLYISFHIVCSTHLQNIHSDLVLTYAKFILFCIIVKWADLIGNLFCWVQKYHRTLFSHNPSEAQGVCC